MADLMEAGRNSRAKILDCALSVFSSKGYDAATVREICECAGVTKPVLYYFFQSKEGVYRAIVDGSLEELRERLVDAISTPGSTSEILKRVARVQIDFARERPVLTRFLFSLVHSLSSNAPVTDFARFYEDIVAMIAEVVERGVRRCELAPDHTETRMIVFMGSISEAICGYLVVGKPELTHALADKIVTTILKDWTVQARYMRRRK